MKVNNFRIVIIIFLIGCLFFNAWVEIYGDYFDFVKRKLCRDINEYMLYICFMILIIQFIFFRRLLTKITLILTVIVILLCIYNWQNVNPI
jgi:hypothetical protein